MVEKDKVLEVENLNVWYRSGALTKQRTHVLHDVSFTLHRGEILGLVGESGSGKSTLARAILGMGVTLGGIAMSILSKKSDETTLKLSLPKRGIFFASMAGIWASVP